MAKRAERQGERPWLSPLYPSEEIVLDVTDSKHTSLMDTAARLQRVIRLCLLLTALSVPTGVLLGLAIVGIFALN